MLTYELTTLGDRPALRCRLCHSISVLEGDIANRYCGRCHLFLESVEAARYLHQNGGTHECGEWQTARGVCAVCEATMVDALAAELAAHEAPIEMVLRPASAFQLASLLQLALRHPDVSEDLRRVGLMFIEHVRTYFADAPVISDLLARGNDPTQDVRRG